MSAPSSLIHGAAVTSLVTSNFRNLNNHGGAAGEGPDVSESGAPED